MLIVFSGLPGVGKSTIADQVARHLHACVVSVDPIENALFRSGIRQSFETGVAAYQVAAVVAEVQLRNGLDVIVDAANYLEAGRDVWRSVSDTVGSTIAVVQVVCTDTAEHRRRLLGRSRGLAAYPEPTWEDVEQREWDTEPWDEPHLVVDSAAPIEASTRLIADYVHERR